MKRFLSVLLVLSLLILPSSCSYVEDGEAQSGELSIVATIFPYYDFAKNIAGDRASVKMLLSPGNEPHSYDPSPSDIVAIENCDIFIYNGGESEKWVESVLSGIENKDICILRMMDYVTLKCEEEHSEHAHEDEEHHHEYDEHIWTSVRNSQIICRVLRDALSELDAQGESGYFKNYSDYASRLDAIDNEIKKTVESARRNTLVFGDRFPLLYFTEDYNLDYEAAFPGCSSETEPSIAVVTELIDYVRDNDIPAVFCLDFSSEKTARLISEDSNAEVLRFYSCHNVTAEQFANGETYVSLMQRNLNSLKEALK